MKLPAQLKLSKNTLSTNVRLSSNIKIPDFLSSFFGVKFVDKLLFTKHLSMMAASSITIAEALAILADQTESQLLRKTLLEMENDIKNGKSLTQAMQKHPKIFDSFYTSIIEVGETSGTIDKSLQYLSSQLAKEYAFRKKVQGAMMYPVIVLTAAGLVGVGVAIFVLPKLIDLFKGFDVKLPLSTQILLFIATAMQNFGIGILIGLIGFVILIRFVLTRKAVKPYIDRALFYIPVFGKILQNAELASFCRNVGIMLKSGIPITSCLAIEVKISTNTVYQLYVLYMLAATQKGKSLSAELESGQYKKIPLIVTKMIAVGERTGKLEETLLYLADFFEDEVDDAVRNISTVIEPVMLLLIGGVVAFVALAIISPIYSLTGSVGR